MEGGSGGAQPRIDEAAAALAPALETDEWSPRDAGSMPRSGLASLRTAGRGIGRAFYAAALRVLTLR
eukprot:COSAG03_NODE_23677_length_278_cov_0.575419_1_plen_66_part_10